MYLTGLTAKYLLSDKKGFNGNVSVGTGLLWYRGISKINQLDGSSSGNAIERNRVIKSNATYGNIGAGISYASDWTQYKGSEISSFKIELSIRHFLNGNLKILDYENLYFPPIPGQPPISDNRELVDIITNSLPIHRVATINDGPLSGWFITLYLVQSGTINWKKKQKAG